MNSFLKRYIKLIAAAFLLVCFTACTANTNEKEDLASILPLSFERIYYAKYALDFPHTENALNKCIQYNNKPCIKVYNLFTKGKNTLISLPADEALDVTLDIIESACLSKDKATANNTCYGGIMSLYFYKSAQQDARILTRVKKYPKKIRNMIFNHDFFWYYNRPNRNEWINYIELADVDWEHKNQKQFILNMFNKSIDDVDDEPWVLR